ncbi:MFS transporter [Cupriavidus taiwanensis]|uniref:MFS transporter n=1 Tax=Cupriavidus taiwanensis TaxID=164546 RepID=UPI00254112BB|nr:MFS transporter [Cupriavidus taiwanensis]MDK3026425.1 MFS transporter [Cupriavidus taiwanensis]
MSAREDGGELDSLYRRVTIRIVPFLFIAYVVAIIDRINIGFAQLHMRSELGFSDAVYGLGAGIFYLGYVVFQVPSNVLLRKIGARKTFARILLVWGAASMAMSTVRTPEMLYFLRFLLGTFEAGFFPGIILYLTYWFPASRRARATSWLFVAVTLSGIIGSVASGAIMQYFNGVLGLSNWQWLFVLEGVPAVLLGVIARSVVADSPNDVRWLSSDEKKMLAEDLQLESRRESAAPNHSFLSMLANQKILALIAVYFTLSCGAMAISFWLPIMVNSAGSGSMLKTGLFSAFPYVVGMFGVALIARHSDRRNERRFHYAICIISAGVAMGLLPAFTGNLPAILVLLCVGVTGTFAAFPIFWSVPHRFLSDKTAAAGLALVSCLGQIGGFVSPVTIGWIKSVTGRMDNGLYALSGVMVLGGIGMVFILRSSSESVPQRGQPLPGGKPENLP